MHAHTHTHTHTHRPCVCDFQVKYCWLKRQRPGKALLLAARAGGGNEPLFLRLLRTEGFAGADVQVGSVCVCVCVCVFRCQELVCGQCICV